MQKICDYKITLIPPEDDFFICKGLIDGDERHSDVMRHYGTMIFGDCSVFNILNDKSSPTIIEHYLELYGYIVFYNICEDFGILCVLNEITDRQRKLLDELLNQLNGYTVEFDYYNDYFDELLFDDPIEDNDDFMLLRKRLDEIVVKDNVKEYVR